MLGGKAGGDVDSEGTKRGCAASFHRDVWMEGKFGHQIRELCIECVCSVLRAM